MEREDETGIWNGEGVRMTRLGDVRIRRHRVRDASAHAAEQS